jgi:predicted nucleotidyltransferase
MDNNLNRIPDLDRVIEFFRSQPVIRAYIFGSYARGDNSADSDIDILVEVEKGTDLFRFIKIKLQLEKLLNRTVDLVSSNGLSRRLKPIIDAEKILVYEK